MLDNISELDTETVDEQAEQIRTLFELEEDPLDVAIKINSVSKHEPGKGPEDRTKDWSEKTGKPVPDKHQKGNNSGTPDNVEGRSDRRGKFLTTLIEDGLEEIEQEKSNESPLKDAGQYYSDEQLQEILETDYSYDGKLDNWKSDLEQDADESTSEVIIPSDKEAKKLSKIARKEKYFGQKIY